MRLFVALAVPGQVADELEAAVAPFRSSWPGLRWTGRDAWHLTLAFFGEVRESVAAELGAKLADVAAANSSLTLSLAGSGAFPDGRRAHVLWTGVQGDGLGSLAAAVGEGAKKAEAPPVADSRSFQAHLTLARCRVPVDVRSLVADLHKFAGTPWTAGEIYLIRSRPQSRPRYETLGSWPLRAATPPA
jgi:2'-5' RNA ligase